MAFGYTGVILRAALAGVRPDPRDLWCHFTPLFAASCIDSNGFRTVHLLPSLSSLCYPYLMGFYISKPTVAMEILFESIKDFVSTHRLLFLFVVWIGSFLLFGVEWDEVRRRLNI